MLVVAKIGKETRASTAGQPDSPGAGARGPGDPPDLCVFSRDGDGDRSWFGEHQYDSLAGWSS